MALIQIFGGNAVLNFPFLLGIFFLPWVAYCVYNLWFHPLSKFPGPRKVAVLPVWAMRVWTSGNYVESIKELHDIYGPVVRVAPNQLSFSSATSWKDIYAHTPGRKQFLKGSFYEAMPGEAYNIVSICNVGAHAAMRKDLSHGFSATALFQQEDLIQHFVDKLISQIGIYGTQTPIDMVKWYNLTTFDIIGELSFGEAFGGLEAGEPHFWQETIFSSVHAQTFLRSFEYFQPLRSLFRFLFKNKLLPNKNSSAREKFVQYSHDKVQKRLQLTPSRIDFLTKMISKDDRPSVRELQSQAGALTVAGSETTATSLSGITYYLCRNEEVYKKLALEIRGAFERYEQIDGRSTLALPYLKAVIDEGLRIYPPIPIGLPRVSPGETVDGHYIPSGATVFTSMWAATHSEKNFQRAFEFIPERWIDPDCQDQKLASQPFLTGSRICLGRHLAAVELRVILAKIFWTFDFELKDDSLDWNAANRSYVFWEKPELPVQFKHRHED